MNCFKKKYSKIIYVGKAIHLGKPLFEFSIGGRLCPQRDVF